MTRIAFLKKYILKFAIALALLGLIVYMLAHATGFLAGSLYTMPVRTISDRQITAATAYLFRDERVLYAAEGGIMDTLVESGSKVGKNVSVARVYESALAGDELEQAQRVVDDLNRMIRILEQSELSEGTPVSEANEYRAEAKKNYLFIREAITSGSLKALAGLEDTFLILLNRYMTLSGKEVDFSASLAELRAQKESLLGGTYTEIRNGDDGEKRSSGTFYDSSYVDGCEGIFTVSALDALTADSFAQLRQASAETSDAGAAVGKMVYGYSWYLAMELDSTLASRFSVGHAYGFSFPQNEGTAISLTLEKTCEGENGTILVFRSDDTPADFDYYRSQTVEITVDSCEGFYVPESALQTMTDENGTEVIGVYIFENSTVRFRRADILYRGDGYCIVARPEDSALTKFDENDILITSGKDLYDGKVYQ
ncbi:MAG: hypothetical protein IJX80_00175 [Clostridia bacterium]|nr:hypothetical protein [Clostridia bacterium]